MLGKRATGKTFRAVLFAMTKASEGHNVYYDGPTSAANLYAFQMGTTIAECLNRDSLEIQYRERIIKIIGAGQVAFRMPQNVDKLRGIKNLCVVVDK